MITRPPCIFLVEDDADDRFIMQQAFAEVNFADKVRMFPSSEFFLNTLITTSISNVLPTLFVLDFNMPAINGGELLLKLKQIDAVKEVPIILYSTGMRPILKETLIPAGALDCFEKCLDFKDLCKLAKTLRMIAEGHEVVY
ncbi:MAG TPA: response regulator [Flavisolibacter sp.]|nr:response regulator [Flavisolibacter sp.]